MISLFFLITINLKYKLIDYKDVFVIRLEIGYWCTYTTQLDDFYSLFFIFNNVCFNLMIVLWTEYLFVHVFSLFWWLVLIYIADYVSMVSMKLNYELLFFTIILSIFHTWFFILYVLSWVVLTPNLTFHSVYSPCLQSPLATPMVSSGYVLSVAPWILRHENVVMEVSFVEGRKRMSCVDRYLWKLTVIDVCFWSSV